MKRWVANKYFRKIVEALNDCDIEFRKIVRDGRKGSFGGLWIPKDNGATIRVRLHPNENPVATLIHEALHHAYPEMPEYDCIGEPVALMTKELLHEFSAKQLKTIEKFIPKHKPSQGKH